MEDADRNKLVTLQNYIKANKMVYSDMPLKEFSENVKRLIKKLPMKKDLFIKEINCVFQSEKSQNEKEQQAQIDKLFKGHVEKLRFSEDPGHRFDWISLMIEVEQALYEKYEEILNSAKLDEIARLILKNQSNEIKRDMWTLKNMKECA